jgi:hypothetical protein
MNSTDIYNYDEVVCKYYDYEKSKAKTVKEGETVDGFEVTYVDADEGIILVDAQCKECGQALKLYEALAFGNICEPCLS